MKKIQTSLMLVLFVAATMAAGCSKEEPKVPESKLVGTWTAPLNAGGGTVQGVGGKDLEIKSDHTAHFAVLNFDRWKIEGDQLTFTSYVDHGTYREVSLLKYTIDDFSESTMTLTGKYIYTVGDSVYMEGDMSGVYKKKE